MRCLVGAEDRSPVNGTGLGGAIATALDAALCTAPR